MGPDFLPIREIERVHGPEWCARWMEGLPNYVDVPGEVNVQEIVDAATGLVKIYFVKRRLERGKG